MKLVEQHVIEKGDPRFTRIDKAAFASKNLFYRPAQVTQVQTQNQGPKSPRL